MKYKTLRRISIPSAGQVDLALILEMDQEEANSYDGASGDYRLVAQPGHVDEIDLPDLRSIDEYLRIQGSSLKAAVHDDLLLLHCIVVWQLKSRLVMDACSHRTLYSNAPCAVSDPRFFSNSVMFWVVSSGQCHWSCTLSFETFVISCQ
jgi:hypothetical protein